MPETSEADRERARKWQRNWEFSMGSRQQLFQAFADHRETAYQAGLLAGAKAMQAKAVERVHKANFTHPDSLRESIADDIASLDPAQIARDTSPSSDGV